MPVYYDKISNMREKQISILPEKTELLKDYLVKRDDVLMAFVFGSCAQGQETSESDFDIAIYFKPEEREIGEDITQKI